jgi:hypothetical protein
MLGQITAARNLTKPFIYRTKYNISWFKLQYHFFQLHAPFSITMNLTLPIQFYYESTGGQLYNASRAMNRPARPPAEPSNGTIFGAAALEVDVVTAAPVAEEPEFFAPVPDSRDISLFSRCLIHVTYR